MEKQPFGEGRIVGQNWYSYCGNNPINRVDLWGLCEDDETDDRGFFEIVGDSLSTTSFAVNIVGVGAAASSLALGPEMLVVSEGAAVVATVLDIGATASYLIDFTIDLVQDPTDPDINVLVKTGFGVLSILGDVFLNVSTSYKAAFRGSRFYSTATGRYVARSIPVVAGATKPAIIGTGIGTTSIVVNNVLEE